MFLLFVINLFSPYFTLFRFNISLLFLCDFSKNTPSFIHLKITSKQFEPFTRKSFACCFCCFVQLGLNVRKKRATKNVKLVLQHCCKTSWIAMLRVYHPLSNLLTTWFVAKEGLMWLENAQHRYSTSFAAMLQNKLHVFRCPFFRTFGRSCR